MKQYYGSFYVIILLILKLYTTNVSTFTATFHSMQNDDHYKKDVRFITASIGSVTTLVVLPETVGNLKNITILSKINYFSCMLQSSIF